MYVLMENKWEDMLIVTQLDKSLVRFGKFTGDISKPTRARITSDFSGHLPANFVKSSLAWQDQTARRTWEARNGLAPLVGQRAL